MSNLQTILNDKSYEDDTEKQKARRSTSSLASEISLISPSRHTKKNSGQMEEWVQMLGKIPAKLL
jgi:hypothetical protein